LRDLDFGDNNKAARLKNIIQLTGGNRFTLTRAVRHVNSGDFFLAAPVGLSGQ